MLGNTMEWWKKKLPLLVGFPRWLSKGRMFHGCHQASSAISLTHSSQKSCKLLKLMGTLVSLIKTLQSSQSGGKQPPPPHVLPEALTATSTPPQHHHVNLSGPDAQILEWHLPAPQSDNPGGAQPMRWERSPDSTQLQKQEHRRPGQQQTAWSTLRQGQEMEQFSNVCLYWSFNFDHSISL